MSSVRSVVKIKLEIEAYEITEPGTGGNRRKRDGFALEFRIVSATGRRCLSFALSDAWAERMGWREKKIYSAGRKDYERCNRYRATLKMPLERRAVPVAHQSETGGWKFSGTTDQRRGPGGA